MKKASRESAFIAVALLACAIVSSPLYAIGHEKPILVQDIEAVDYFEFSVCNGTQNETIYVAVTYRSSPNSSNWVVKGWFPADAEGCTKIGTFPKGKFYYFANSATWRWHGSATQQCVEAGSFEHLAGQGSCPSRQLQGFRETNVTDDDYRVSLYPPPGYPRFDLDQIGE